MRLCLHTFFKRCCCENTQHPMFWRIPMQCDCYYITSTTHLHQPYLFSAFIPLDNFFWRRTSSRCTRTSAKLRTAPVSVSAPSNLRVRKQLLQPTSPAFLPSLLQPTPYAEHILATSDEGEDRINNTAATVQTTTLYVTFSFSQFSNDASGFCKQIPVYDSCISFVRANLQICNAAMLQRCSRSRSRARLHPASAPYQ